MSNKILSITTSKCNGCEKDCKTGVVFNPFTKKYTPTLNNNLLMFYQDANYIVHNVQSYKQIQGAIAEAQYMAQECAKQR